MSELDDAVDRYLGSLSAEEWDLLTKRVRPAAGALDAQMTTDPHMIATLSAQVSALDEHIAGIEQQLGVALRDGDPMVSIALKQEKQRSVVARDALRADLERRQQGQAQ